ncbi:MAG: hypothetical protein U0350_40065 [Caldilineaceae bacterium]
MRKLFDNAGDVSGSQIGVGVENVQGDVNASITVTSTSYSTSSSYWSQHDSHDTHSVSYSYDSHDTQQSLVDSHDQYVVNNYHHQDSHNIVKDSYNTTNTQNINASVTSSGQAMMLGIFFGNGMAMRVAMAFACALAVFVWAYAEEILICVAVAMNLVTIGLVTRSIIKRRRQAHHQQLAYVAYQEQMVAQRQLLEEERAFRLRLAEMSRPVYIAVNGSSDAIALLQAQPQTVEIRPRLTEVQHG